MDRNLRKKESEWFPAIKWKKLLLLVKLQE